MSRKTRKQGKCLRKIRYSTFALASKVLGKMRYDNSDPSLEMYLCKYCGGYHLGHDKPRIEKTVEQ